MKPITIGFFVWTALAIIGSLVPGNNLPRIDWLSVLQLDKLVHFMIYFVMCILMYLSMVRDSLWRRIKNKALVVSAISSFGIGVLTEILQSNLIAGRYFDNFDILANTIGVALAMGVIVIKRIK